ncbi:SPOR domain-containing protein [uncultured Tateyamaria sp.]|uniref:SPOR domain-containing protein n=1 Tax=Tateyamaria sp. 1078 TaxID=3417464 RepID=UPI0026058D64|nr:SPOR domain-containing protein [uncultured Tateyamaria sp.]
MSRSFSKSTMRSSVAAVLALSLLAGCDENGQFVAMQAFQSNTETAGTPEPGAPIKTVERDVEAPDVFSATEAGLWDGRPSLGGVWVAHPDVSEPERVIIRNATNNKFVVGALFRRERDIPGPRLQISSDAAEALGMLAGAPAELNVTALRKEDVAVEQPIDAAQTDIEEVDAVEAPAAIATTSLDPIASAAAALDAPTPAPAVSTGIQPAAAPEQPIKAAATTRPAASNLSKPFIQIGIFSIEANATRTSNRMRDAGIVPVTKTFERDGKTFWRVVVGPASSSAERGQLLNKVKEEGFTDAYAVSN